MIVDGHLIAGCAVSKYDFKFSPCTGNARVEPQGVALHGETQNRFETGPIHPSGRTRVPCPTAASDVRCNGVDIRANHVRLDLVALRLGPSARVIDRIEER